MSPLLSQKLFPHAFCLCRLSRNFFSLFLAAYLSSLLRPLLFVCRSIPDFSLAVHFRSFFPYRPLTSYANVPKSIYDITAPALLPLRLIPPKPAFLPRLLFPTIFYPCDILNLTPTPLTLLQSLRRRYNIMCNHNGLSAKGEFYPADLESRKLFNCPFPIV